MILSYSRIYRTGFEFGYKFFEFKLDTVVSGRSLFPFSSVSKSKNEID